MILAALRAGPRSPRAIEEQPPQKMSAREARVAIQALLDDGLAVLGADLKLVATTTAQMLRARCSARDCGAHALDNRAADEIDALRARLAKAEARGCACCAGITLSAGCVDPLASAMVAAERFRETLLALCAPEHTPEMRSVGGHHPETDAVRRRVLDRVGFCWISPGEMAPACLCGFSESWSPEHPSVSSDHLAWRLRGADREETAIADLTTRLAKADEAIEALHMDAERHVAEAVRERLDAARQEGRREALALPGLCRVLTPTEWNDLLEAHEARVAKAEEERDAARAGRSDAGLIFDAGVAEAQRDRALAERDAALGALAEVREAVEAVQAVAGSLRDGEADDRLAAALAATPADLAAQRDARVRAEERAACRAREARLRAAGRDLLDAAVRCIATGKMRDRPMRDMDAALAEDSETPDTTAANDRAGRCPDEKEATGDRDSTAHYDPTWLADRDARVRREALEEAQATTNEAADAVVALMNLRALAIEVGLYDVGPLATEVQRRMSAAIILSAVDFALPHRLRSLATKGEP
jgi:hypothetical protein